MINRTLFLLTFVFVCGTAGVLTTFFPRIIPRMTNAYWDFFGMKSRVAEEDYERLSVRITGFCFIVVALIALIVRWSDIWAGIDFAWRVAHP
jgi:hypothetical protein